MIQFLLALVLALNGQAAAEKDQALLSSEAVWMIVMNTPAALNIECRSGCPDVELIPDGKYLMFVQLRNGCPISGSGMVDNYTIDLRTGQIWAGVDKRQYIDSERLRRLRALLSVKATGGQR